MIDVVSLKNQIKTTQCTKLQAITTSNTKHLKRKSESKKRNFHKAKKPSRYKTRRESFSSRPKDETTKPATTIDCLGLTSKLKQYSTSLISFLQLGPHASFDKQTYILKPNRLL